MSLARFTSTWEAAQWLLKTNAQGRIGILGADGSKYIASLGTPGAYFFPIRDDGAPVLPMKWRTVTNAKL